MRKRLLVVAGTIFFVLPTVAANADSPGPNLEEFGITTSVYQADRSIPHFSHRGGVEITFFFNESGVYDLVPATNMAGSACKSGGAAYEMPIGVTHHDVLPGQAGENGIVLSSPHMPGCMRVYVVRSGVARFLEFNFD